MKKAILFFFTLCMGMTPFSFAFANMAQNHSSVKKVKLGDYIAVIQGFDWGPAVSKVILSYDEELSSTNAKDFKVSVKRSSSCFTIRSEEAKGERNSVFAYISDEKGNRLAKGKHITLVLSVGPDLVIASPIQYTTNPKCPGNNWVDYQMEIFDTVNYMSWENEGGRILPLIDQFDLTGRYTHTDGITMSYASFTPVVTITEKSPLIIWLHGGGEGGTDPTIPLIANRAANYASEEIQSIFGGAHVLVPQCPGAWMHNKKGISTRGRENDIYNQGLMALIKHYVAENPKIDQDRIYVGGCSNGGYMSLKLILLYPEFFAASFPSALAYNSVHISEKQIRSIRKVPIWFIHAKDDRTTPPDQTAVPVYKRLMEAGAENVHFSYYDHVVDITGFFGGENYHYSGHWSWIYSHANLCKNDFDGRSVKIEGKPVTIMEWLAAQSR